MTLRNSISVRLPEETRAQLLAISKKCGLTPAALIRRATEEFIEEVNKNGAINIPVSIRGNRNQVAAFGGTINNRESGGKKTGKKRKHQS